MTLDYRLRKLSDTQRDVLRFMCSQTNTQVIDENIEQAPTLKHILPSTARKRRCDLFQLGIVRRAGFKTKNSRGIEMTVWEVVPEFRAFEKATTAHITEEDKNDFEEGYTPFA